MSDSLTPEEESAYADLLARVQAGRSVPLVMKAPRRGKPPVHWIDLSAAERAAEVEALGMPRFRRGQLDRHLFSHLNGEADGWTD